MPDDPSTVFVLTTLDQLKALADPLRQRILSAMADDAITTKQVAEQLGEKPTRLYHHVDILEQANLIELVETRPVRGTVEKYYRTVARRFVVADDLLDLSSDAAQVLNEIQHILVNVLQESLNDVSQHFAIQHARDSKREVPITMHHSHVRLTQSQVLALTAKLEDWMDECRQADSAAGEFRYAITLALYPVEKQQAE
jgi:DNA-binding transcriptional ArsR family regulator